MGKNASGVSLVLLLLLSQRAAAGCPRLQYLQTVPLPAGPLPAPISAALAAVNASLQAQINNVSMPGFVFSAFYGGSEVATFAGGVADKTSGRPPNPAVDTFRIASNTKIFTCLLAEVFAELGFVGSLDDAVSKYAPAFAGPVNTFGDGAQISFRALMSHTASLPDSLIGGVDWRNETTTQQVFDAIAALPLTVPVGTLPSYSNLGIALLGHVLSEFVAPAAERGDINALLVKYVLGPLGLSDDVGYDLTEGAIARLIPAYFSGGARVPTESLGWAAPCGTMWATIPALARFHQATARIAAGEAVPGFSLSPARARAWLQPVSLTPDNSIALGAPWETYVLEDAGVIVRTKSGTLVGYSTKSALVAELQLSFAYSFNGNYAEWYEGNALLETISRTLVPAFVTALTALQPPRSAGPSASDFVGQYTQDANTNNVAVVSLDGAGQLVLASAAIGASAVLEAVGAALPDAFRLYQDPTSDTCEHLAMDDTAWAQPVVFTRGADGKVASLGLVNWDGAWTKA